MRMTEGLMTCQDKVQTLLIKFPVLRDSDKKLWISYLRHFCGLEKAMNKKVLYHKNHRNDPYEIMKSIILQDSTPTMETITRARRKVQENFPSLKGEKAGERSKEAEKVKEWATT